MRDGVKLSADVFLPVGSGPFPTVLTRTPYESQRDAFVDRGIYMAQHGYAFVVQDVRGRYESEGMFHAYTNEALDGIETLQWVGDQPWCDGKIGTWGRSYGALTQWQLLREGSPIVSCHCAHVMADDYFNDYHYVGGAFQLALSISAVVIWEATQAMIRPGSAELFNNLAFYRHLPLLDLDVEALGREVPYWREWLNHPTNDTYWQSISTPADKLRVAAPVFQQGGWYDPYVESIFRNFHGILEHGLTDVARIGQRVMIAPWSHDEPDNTRIGELDLGPEAYLRMRDEEIRWYDYWLKGIDTGVMRDPPIRIFVMGANRWRSEYEWPLARTVYTPLYLHSGGHANTFFGDGTLSAETGGQEPPDQYEYDPNCPVLTVGGVHSIQMMSAFAEVPIQHGPFDQRSIERRDDVLVFTSPPLENDLEVTGPIELVLFAASSARDTDFTAKLADVYPDGQAMCITEGIIRARYRHSDKVEELLQPGAIEEYHIHLYPTSNVFKVNHRIRLDVSSSNFPRFSRNLNTGEDVASGTRWVAAQQTVLHDAHYPSHLVLPVIPSNAESG